MNTNKKDKWLGQFRVVLTAAGTVLLTWGISDGNTWTPAIGILLALTSLLWGVAYHRDPAKPGKIRWSLFRKFVNATGTAVVTYGALHPDQVESIAALVAVLGPTFAAVFSWVDNDDDPENFGNGPYIPVVLLTLCLLFLPSCGITITEDGCILGSHKHNSSTYQAGPCMGPDRDGDGQADIDRFRVQWSNEDGQHLRATYWLSDRPILIEYQTGGIWVNWSAKAGISLGPLPPEIQSLEPEPTTP